MERLTGRDTDGTIVLRPSASKRDAYTRLGFYEDTNLTPAEIAAMQAELAAYRQAEQEGRIVRVPVKVGDTVYVISNCEGVSRALDGTLYSFDGSPGTATGYYCAFDERWDECPLAAGREACDEKSYAVFEDTVSHISVQLGDEYDDPGIYIGLAHVANYRDDKIYHTQDEARAALDK